MKAERLVERIEDGITSYRQHRRARRNATADSATDSTDGVERSTEIIMDGTKWATPLFTVDAPADGPTAFVLGGQQGWEKSGVKAADIIRRMTPESGTIVSVPIANQTSVAMEYEDDYARLVERNETHHGENITVTEPDYTGLINDPQGVTGDMNDQWLRGQQPEIDIVREIWNRFQSADPDIAFDLHSSGGLYKHHGSDGVGQAIFPTPDQPAQDAADHTIRTLNEAYLAEFPQCYDYVKGNAQGGGSAFDHSFAHKVGADHDGGGCLLCETGRMNRNEPQRVLWHVVTLVEALDTYGMTFEESLQEIVPDAPREPQNPDPC